MVKVGAHMRQDKRLKINIRVNRVELLPVDFLPGESSTRFVRTQSMPPPSRVVGDLANCYALYYTYPMPTLRQAVFGPTPLPFSLVEDLIDAAAEAARLVRMKRVSRRPQRAQLTLRPGPNTPLWNELVRQVRPHLRKYGSKAQLARLLGLPRQRMHDCLKSQAACLDAERTLLLLGWLGFFQRGGELTPIVRPVRSRKSVIQCVTKFRSGCRCLNGVLGCGAGL